VRLGLDTRNQALAAARHQHINCPIEAAQHFTDCGAVTGRHQCDRVVRKVDGRKSATSAR
jgi:hypothetical protein